MVVRKIGKNLVSTMLHGVGFEVRDIKVNIPVEDFVRQAMEYRPDILRLSALLTTSLSSMLSARAGGFGESP